PLQRLWRSHRTLLAPCLAAVLAGVAARRAAGTGDRRAQRDELGVDRPRRRARPGRRPAPQSGLVRRTAGAWSTVLPVDANPRAALLRASLARQAPRPRPLRGSRAALFAAAKSGNFTLP